MNLVTLIILCLTPFLASAADSMIIASAIGHGQDSTTPFETACYKICVDRGGSDGVDPGGCKQFDSPCICEDTTAINIMLDCFARECSAEDRPRAIAAADASCVRRATTASIVQAGPSSTSMLATPSVWPQTFGLASSIDAARSSSAEAARNTSATATISSPTSSPTSGALSANKLSPLSALFGVGLALLCVV